MEQVEPIFLVELFPKINRKLTELLASLSLEDWNRPTISPKWKIKDIASHLLDGNFRRISNQRDGYSPPAPGTGNYQDLVDYLNQLNSDWIKATQRLSPQVLIELHEYTGEKVYQIFKGLDPFEEAVFPVSWAGDNSSPNWFDIAREYTEKWIHQQQIRDALEDRTLLDREFFLPCLDTLMRGLPHTYRHLKSPRGTLLKITSDVEGEVNWFLVRQNDRWELVKGQGDLEITTLIYMDKDFAWKFFSNGIKDWKIAEKGIEVKGDHELGKKILDMVSVMA